MRKYQRTGRIIQANHSTALPRYVLAVDTETNRSEDSRFGDAFAHSFRLGCLRWGRYDNGKIVGNKQIRFSNPSAFWNVLRTVSDCRHTTWVVGHNVLFDLIQLGFTDQFERTSIVLDQPRRLRSVSDDQDEEQEWSGLCVLENPPFIMGIRIPETGGRIVIVDTMNWFRCSLEEIGEQIGLAKVPLPAFTDDDNAWFERCERDVDITFEAFISLMRWTKENDFGMFRYTSSAQSMAAYRHRFCKQPIYFHDNMELKKLERKAFIGGRVECFKLGKIDQDVYAVDVNSMYPYLMSIHHLPFKLEWHENPTEFQPFPAAVDPSKCIAEVQLETYVANYPVKTNSGIIYPIGRFETWLAGPELEYAVNSGDVRGVRFLSFYETADLFSEWVNALWSLRKDYEQCGNKLYATLTKNMLNSLFGKWAQRGSEWHPVGMRGDALPWQQWFGPGDSPGETAEYRSIGWSVFRKGERPELPKTMIAISAFVASLGRRYMNLQRRIAGPENVFYQGVDGLLVNSDGFELLKAADRIDDNAIGKLKLAMTANRAYIYNGNDYTIGDKVVIAGRSKIVSDPDATEIKHRIFSGLAGLFDERVGNRVIETERKWNRTEGYNKGNVLPDGTIRPLELGI